MSGNHLQSAPLKHKTSRNRFTLKDNSDTASLSSSMSGSKPPVSGKGFGFGEWSARTNNPASPLKRQHLPTMSGRPVFFETGSGPNAPKRERWMGEYNIGDIQEVLRILREMRFERQPVYVQMAV